MLKAKLQFKEIRKDKGYNQTYVSKVLGITQSAYSKKEKGLRAFSPQELIKLEVLFNCTLNEFYKI